MNARARLLTLGLALSVLSLSSPTEAFIPSGFLPRKETQTRLSWGGVYHRVDGITPNGAVTVHYVMLDAVRFRPAVALPSSGMGTVIPLVEMVREMNAFVGLNANFFDPPSGLPIGFLLKDGRVLNTPYASRATLAVGFFGELHFMNPRISLVLRTPQGPIPIDGINRPAYGDAIIVYTPEYAGPRGFWSRARIVSVQGNRIISISSNGSARLLSRDGYWIVATGSAQARLANLLPAERVQVDYIMDPERYFVRDALQAGPMLLQEGQIALTPEGFSMNVLQQPAARSALALTGDGALILALVTRGNGSVGMTLWELAEYLRTLGALDALAFDGGGSSSLVFQDGVRLRTLGSTRQIPVGLVFLRR